jgi:hypothetical protein
MIEKNHILASDGTIYRVVAIQNDETGKPLSLVLGHATGRIEPALVAAAPKLLAALQSLVGRPEFFMSFDDSVLSAREAIEEALART